MVNLIVTFNRSIIIFYQVSAISSEATYISLFGIYKRICTIAQFHKTFVLTICSLFQRNCTGNIALPCSFTIYKYRFGSFGKSSLTGYFYCTYCRIDMFHQSGDGTYTPIDLTSL